jgi:uncharacterized protein (TIGR00661 family)
MFHQTGILSQAFAGHLDASPFVSTGPSPPERELQFVSNRTLVLRYSLRLSILQANMTNILYGVNGEGSGHSSRAREMIAHLEEQGHVVHVVSFDRGLKNLAADFDVTEVFGMRLATIHNRVRYGRTVLRNLLTVPRAAKSARTLNHLAEKWGIQLVITDFEPLSCHTGRKLGLPVLSIDNQHCLTYGEISYPREYRKEAAATKIVTRLMTPSADAYFVTSFFSARPKNKRTFFFPPILRRAVLESAPVDGDAVVVYITSPADELIDILKGIRQNFVCYGLNREGREGNLWFKKPSQAEFLKDLTIARAVVANSGFSLISEALHLGKPYLAWPVKHQFEQVFNAYYIGKMGYGAYWDDLTREKVESFLFNLDAYRENLTRYPRNDNSSIFEKMDEFISKYAR